MYSSVKIVCLGGQRITVAIKDAGLTSIWILAAFDDYSCTSVCRIVWMMDMILFVLRYFEYRSGGKKCLRP